jgi:hypothetical protein
MIGCYLIVSVAQWGVVAAILNRVGDELVVVVVERSLASAVAGGVLPDT